MAICLPQVSKNIWDFDPRSIPGCQLWLDGADQSSMTFSGSTITQWNDKSGRGISIPSTGTPTITTVNGRSSVSFNGSSYFIRSNFTGLFNSSYVSWIAVANVTNSASASYLSVVGTSYQVNNYSENQMYINSGNILLYYRGFNGDPARTDTVSLTSGTNILQTITDFRDGSYQIYQNGTGSTVRGGGPTSLATSEPINLTIGHDLYPGDTILVGTISEILLYTQPLTTSQRQQVEGYLAHKWGLTSNFPAAPTTQTFNFTGAIQSWTAPAGTTSVTVTVNGAGGGGAGSQTAAAGGRAVGTMAVTPGQTYYIVVGGGGGAAVGAFQGTSGAGGFGGGGVGFTGTGGSACGGGGGYSGIFSEITLSQGNALVIAGGGGGVASNNGSSAGAGGGTTGGNGGNPGGGGTQSAGGTGGVFGNSGSALRGGDATTASTAGGGGGYWGGGAGVGGGGGSGFVGGLSSVTTNSQGGGGAGGGPSSNGGNGSITIITSTVAHPFSSIRPHLRTFQPTDISGCELWFDGGDNTTMFQNTAGTIPVTAAAQSVACWKDKIRNLSITNTGVPGQSMLAPTSVSGGGVFFNNTSTVVSASAQGLGTSLTGGPTQQNRFLFRMPNKLMTLITASYPLSNNNYRQILCLATNPIGSTPPNFNIGHEIGATNGGTVLFDFNGSNWGQVSVSTSGYNTSTILRIDSLVTDANPLWLTNGTVNTFTQTNTYTSGNTNYPVNSIAMGGYSSTFVGSRNFRGTIYETVLYSKLLTTSERQQVEGYLAHKWGIISAIPSTHPFKTFPPSDVNTQDIGFGGKIERNNGITYHVFISSNIFVVYRGQNINYLIVGGGGGGGDRHGGGGGGGGVLSGTFFASINIYSITVGEGGIGANAEFTDAGAVGFNSTPRGTGLKGGNSSIIGGGQSITAFGGGGGGSNDGNPTGTFGSGGGGGGNNHPGVAGTAGQGNSGGSGLNPGAGGGGGAGGAGVAANTGTGGVGTTAHSTTLLAVGYGTRIAVPTSPNTVISGGVAYIASGGGGSASVSPGPGGSGGIGGGGRGDWNNVFISAGTPNTGGGGGGARSFTPTGESCGRPGGSGLVIIWY